MSLCYRSITGRVWMKCLFLMLATGLLSVAAMAQDDAYPKAELFVGYQWLNPGGTIPAAGHSFFAPVPNKLHDIPQGAGTSLTWNFTKLLGLEGDYGGNWNKYGNESTGSIGPKLTWRGDGVNFFAHTLLSYNRFTTNGLNPSNGIGAILEETRSSGAHACPGAHACADACGHSADRRGCRTGSDRRHRQIRSADHCRTRAG